MKPLLYTIAFLMTLTGFSQSLADLDAKNGFRQFKFGSSPAQLAHLKK